MKIICECGCNFNNLKEAMKLIDKTKELGAFLSKFQIYNEANIKNSRDYKFLKEIMINEEKAKTLFEYGKTINQEVFFTCFYPEAVDICERIGVKYYKVRYFDRNNLPLYRKLKKTKDKLIFVSCQHPHDTIFYNMGKYQKRVKFLYVIPQYPAKLEDYEGFLIEHFRDNPEKGLFPNKDFKGISDHTPDLRLFQIFNSTKIKPVEYFEMHMCMNKEEAIEGKWSKTFKELKEVL